MAQRCSTHAGACKTSLIRSRLCSEVVLIPCAVSRRPRASRTRHWASCVDRTVVHEVNGAMRCRCASDMVLLAAPCSEEPWPKASVQCGRPRAEGDLLLPHSLGFSFHSQLVVKPPAKLKTSIERPMYAYTRSSGGIHRVFGRQQQSGAGSKMLAKAEMSVPACSPVGNPHDSCI